MPHRPVVLWLSLCCALIFLMTVIGAITRLTESGLSITRWEPVRGALPPLNDTAWDEAFTLYKASPQYQLLNKGMALEDFKKIYFWEWLHRLWGRVIGLAFLLPFLFFLARGMIPKGFKAPLFAALLLGGLQGYMGWFMVQSGLTGNMVSVSHLRLAAHLSLALIIFALLFWQILRLLKPRPLTAFVLQPLALCSLGLLALTIIWGAFTAGLDAGKIYNTWPLMNGTFLPSDFLALTPPLENAINNPAAVQFIHRWLGALTAIALLFFAWHIHKRGGRRTALALGLLTTVQFALGLLTLLSGAELFLAAAHQANMVLLLAATLTGLYLTNKNQAA